MKDLVEILPNVFIETEEVKHVKNNLCEGCRYYEKCDGMFFDRDTTLRDICNRLISTTSYPVNVEKVLAKIRLYNKGRE